MAGERGELTKVFTAKKGKRPIQRRKKRVKLRIGEGAAAENEGKIREAPIKRPKKANVLTLGKK